MYNEFYGFSEAPFNVTPGARFLFLTHSHREALAAMMYGIKERKGFISVTGEVGTGKTTLIHALLKQRDEKLKTAFIFHTNITFEELLKNIFFELKIPLTEDGKPALLRFLNEYLIQSLSRDENFAVIVDEAQNLSMEVLEEVRMLSNLETPRMKLLQILLVGQPELEVKLNSESLRQLKQRIGIRRQISPLSQDESEKYIDHRLTLVGSSSPKVFTSEAVSLICDYARGIPRTINILCDNALLIGYGLSSKKIGGKIVREAIGDMGGPTTVTPPSETVPTDLSRLYVRPQKVDRKSRTVFRLAIVIIVIVACLALLLLWGRGRGYLQGAIDRSGNVHPGRNFMSRIVPGTISADPAVTSLDIQTPSVGTLTRPGKPDQEPPFFSGGTREVKKVVVVARERDCISSLVQKHYRVTNETLVDLLLESNPEITNVHMIRLNQEIRFPEITDESIIIQLPDFAYKIHLATFARKEFSGKYDGEPALRGKELETIPRKVAPGETWYRVVVGKYSDKNECLKVISTLKERSLLPVFEGV